MQRTEKDNSAYEGYFVYDSKEPTLKFADYALNENRYRMLKMANPEHCDELMAASQKDVERSWKFLQSRFKSLEQA